jgi:hypothetical protein
MAMVEETKKPLKNSGEDVEKRNPHTVLMGM